MVSPRGTRRSSGLTAWLAETWVKPACAGQFRQAAFVFGVFPGVHQHDGAGVDAVGVAPWRRMARACGFVERFDLVAVDADATVDLGDLLIQHRRQGDGEVEQARARLVADAQGVGEAAVDQQERAVALALQQRVGGDGGAHLHRLDQPGGMGSSASTPEHRLDAGDGGVACSGPGFSRQQLVGGQSCRRDRARRCR